MEWKAHILGAAHQDGAKSDIVDNLLTSQVLLIMDWAMKCLPASFSFFYCLSVWASTTKKQIARLQKVQTFAAKVATGARKFDHITPTLKQLQ